MNNTSRYRLRPTLGRLAVVTKRPREFDFDRPEMRDYDIAVIAASGIPARTARNVVIATASQFRNHKVSQLKFG